MHGSILARQQFVVGTTVLRSKLHEEVLVIEFPELGIEFQKEVIAPEIAEEETAVAVAQMETIMTEGYVDGVFH